MVDIQEMNARAGPHHLVLVLVMIETEILRAPLRLRARFRELLILVPLAINAYSCATQRQLMRHAVADHSFPRLRTWSQGCSPLQTLAFEVRPGCGSEPGLCGFRLARDVWHCGRCVQR